MNSRTEEKLKDISGMSKAVLGGYKEICREGGRE